MKKTSYSTVFRLNTLSAMVGLALSSGYVRDAYADCEEVVDNNRVEVVCSDSMTLTDTVGTGPNSTIDGFTAAPDARITIEDKIAVSLGDSASVTISDGAGLMNYRLTTGGGGGYGTGRSAVEIGSHSRVDVGVSAYIDSVGETTDNSAGVALMGGGSTIRNQGTISAWHAPAIRSFASGEEGGLVIINEGLIVASTSAIDPPGDFAAIDTTLGSASLILNNSGVINGGLKLGDGDDIIRNSGMIIGGDIDAGGGNNTLHLQSGSQTNPTLLGAIKGVQSIVKDEEGTWTLAGAITNAPETELSLLVSKGTLVIGNTVHGDVLIEGTVQLGDNSDTGSITGDVKNNGTLVLNNPRFVNNPIYDVVLGGAISGTGALIQAEGGGTILTGENTYSGGTTIAKGGTLQVGNGAASGSIVGDVSNDGTLTFNRTGATSLDGKIIGSGSVSQIGDGTLTLTGANEYEGGTLIQNGTISIANDNALGLGSGKVTLIDGTLKLTDTVSSNRDIEITGQSGSIDAAQDTTTTLNGVISGDGGLTGTGGGTIVLTRANIYQGITTITAGTTLQIGDNGHRGSIVSDVSNAGTLVMYGHENEQTYDGKISGDGNLVVKGELGTVTLTGDNTFGGGTTIDEGSTLQLGAGGTAGSILGNVTNNGTLLFNRSNEMLLSGVIDGTGQVVQFGAGTTILTGNNTYEGGTTINGGGTLQVGDGGIHGSIQGGVLNHGTLAFKRQDDTSFEGRIRGMGQVEQRGAGTLTLTGENSYEGGTRISAGSIAVGVDTALGAKTGNVILAGGSLILTGNITSGREIMLEDAASAITASTGTTSILNGAISGAGGLTSNGGGTLALSGPNSYTGGTTIRSGTVSVGSDGALGDLAGSVTLDGGTLIFSREVTSARDIKITESGGTISSSVGNWWAGESTLSGEISGVGGLNVSGRGTLALTGNNSYSGGTEITSTVAINNSHALGTGTVSLNGGRLELRAGLNLANDILLTSASGTITANGGTGTLSGVMSGEGGLTADGPGTLILNGENTYRGGTTIRAGTVIIGSDSALGDGTGRVTLDGGRLKFSRAVTSDRSIEITAAGGIIRADTDTTSTLRGSISGRGTLYADGPGTLVLEGENTYERGTVISNGAIAINNDKALGAAASTVLLANGRLELRGNVDSARGIMISGNSGTIRVTEGNTGILDGVISGTGGLTSDGRGTLVLTAENTYNGGTIIAEGSNLQIGNGGNSGSIVGDVTNNGTLTFNRAGPTSFGASISGSGRVAQIGDGTLTLTGDNTYDGGTVITGTVAIDNSNALGTGSVTFDGGRLDLMKSMALANDFVITAASGTIMTNENVTGVLDGAISGEGDLTLIGPALFYLNGQNSYEGGTTIRSATLFIGNDGALGKSDGGVTLNEGVLALARGVASGRDIKLTNWGEIRADSSEVSRFDGTIFGDGLLIATGPGTLTLTGENTYTGGTEVINGAIAINNGNALGTGSVELDNGRLELEDGVTLLNDVNITHASGTIRVAGGSKATLAGPISGEGGITMDGRGTLVLNDGNTYAGGTTIHSGTVSIGNDSALGRSRGDVIVGAGTLAFSSDVTSNRRIELKPGAFIRAGNGTVSTLSGQISGEGALSANGPGTLMLTGENTYAGGTEIINGAVAISDDKALGAATGGVSLDNGRLEFTSRVTTERDIWITPASGTITAREGTSTLNGTISGPGRLITTGPGTLILNGQNDYAGGTTIRSGTVSIAHDSALGDAAGSLAFDQGTLALTGNVDSSRSVYLSGTSGGSATISTQRDTVSTFRGWISGEGGLTSAGPGTLVLTGDNRYEGGTTIAGGTLRLGDGGTRGSIQGDVENHGVLAFNRRDAVLFAGAISGSGAVVQRGSGLTVLTGDHTYTGGTTITDGALQLGDGGTTGSIVGDVSNDGRFIFNRRDTVAFGGTIRGTGQVIQRGAGTTILNAFNTYEGATTVAAGTLIIGDSQHSHAALAGGGGVQVDPGATFGGYGTVTGNVTNQGTIAVANASPGFNDNGSFTVAGSLSNSGLIQIGGKGVGNRLIVLGDYAGDNGVIALNSVLSGDSSTADQIVIQRGLASGSTALRVTNLGGEGGYTSGNGVAVILAQEGARTSEGSFALSAPVVAGPYEYTLYRGSADASAPDNWYLRSARPDGRADYRQEVSVYGTLAPTALMVGRTLVDSLAERTGSPEQAHPDAPAMRDHRLWGRYVGSQGRRSGSGDGIYGDYGARHDYQFNGMQLGGDLLRRQHTDGSRDMAGLTAAMGEAKTTVDHYNGNDAGDGRIKAYSLGAYWTHFGAQDWYLDTGLMITKYRLEGDTHRGLPKMRTDGWGVLANVEGGYPFPLNNQWVLEPQAQLTFQSIDIDSVHDGVADVRFNDVQSLVGRLGVKMGRHWKSESDSDGKAFSVWARLSVLHEAFGRSKTAYSAQEGHVTFNSDIGGSWTQFMLGVSGSATDNMSLYATAAYQETFSGAKADSWNGKVGVRWHW